jgi:lipoprotein-releasing system permease protein
MSLEWRVARRYLSSRRGTRFLSLITLIAIGGVAVGVTALIVVIGVMTGLQRELRAGILGVNPHVWVLTYSEGMQMPGWPEPLERVRAMPDVEAAAPFVHTEMALRNRAGYVEASVLRGIDMGGGADVTRMPEVLRDAGVSLGPTQSGLPPITVGYALASRLTLVPGDTVTIMSLQNHRVTAVGFMPRMEQFEYVGGFRTGMWEYDNRFSYTALAPAAQVAGLGEGVVSGLEVRTIDEGRAREIGLDISERLGLPYRTDDWMSMNASLFSALELEKLAMGLILILIVVVAAFNIVSTLVMVVTDKTREIGILKSMGMTSRRILNVFMIQGLVIGIVGATLGVAGGATLTWVIDYFELIRIPGEIYFVSHLPVAFDPVDVSIILAATVLISFLATIYPALQAARLTPVEAIRHE